MNATPVDQLRSYLALVEGGPDPIDLLQHQQQLIPLLIAAWPDFAGHDQQAMASFKLQRGLDAIQWTPPATLRFEIERHGGTVNGSSRAERQGWTLDLERRTAEVATVGHKQLWPMARRLNVTPIAEELAEKIVRSEEDQRLTEVDPISRTSDPYGRKSPICLHRSLRTRRNSADRWSSWSKRAARPRNSRVSSAALPRASRIGWRKRPLTVESLHAARMS